MRVALLLPELVGGGAERVLLEVAHGLVEHDIDVDIVLVRSGGALRDSVPNGARVIDLHVKRTLFAGRRLRRYLARERPTVVISALTPTNVANIVVTRLVRPRIPAIVTQHSMTAAHSTTKADRAGLLAARWSFPHADRVVAVSEGVATDLVDAVGIDEEQISVIPNPVISSRLFADAQAAAAHPWLVHKVGRVVLAAGRLTAQKDFATLLRAVALLPSDHRLVLLGEGELRHELTELAERLGFASASTSPGTRPILIRRSRAPMSSCCRRGPRGCRPCSSRRSPSRAGSCRPTARAAPARFSTKAVGAGWCRAANRLRSPTAIEAEITARRARPHDAWKRYEVTYAAERYIELIGALTDT